MKAFRQLILVAGACCALLATGCEAGSKPVAARPTSPAGVAAVPLETFAAQDGFRVVMLADDPGYELHMPRASAEQLQAVVENEVTLALVSELLSTGVTTASVSAGFDPKMADLFAQVIVKLFTNNAEKFKTDLAANLGPSGIILTVQANRPWVIKTGGELGLRFDIADPIGTTNQNMNALMDFVLKKVGAEEAMKTKNELRDRFRQMLWASETPVTVLVDSSTWNIRPRQ